MDPQSRVGHHRFRAETAEIAERQSVGRGDFADVIAADQAAGAGHVPGEDRGIAGNMRAEMPGDEPAFGIGRAARREVDEQGDLLALVEGRRLRSGAAGGKTCRNDDRRSCGAR